MDLINIQYVWQYPCGDMQIYFSKTRKSISIGSRDRSLCGSRKRDRKRGGLREVPGPQRLGLADMGLSICRCGIKRNIYTGYTAKPQVVLLWLGLAFIRSFHLKFLCIKFPTHLYNITHNCVSSNKIHSTTKNRPGKQTF